MPLEQWEQIISGSRGASLLCTVDSFRVAAGIKLKLQTLLGNINVSFSKHTADCLSKEKYPDKDSEGRVSELIILLRAFKVVCANIGWEII